jgi:hypothetical protein
MARILPAITGRRRDGVDLIKIVLPRVANGSIHAAGG